MIPTYHSIERIKKRVGLNKKSSPIFIEKAQKFGLRLADFKCRPNFYNYLNSLTNTDIYDLFIYNRYILVMQINTEVCVTILYLPKEYYSTVESVYKLYNKE